MNIQVRGDRLDVTPAMREYVEKKVSRLEKFFDAPPEREVSVTMSVERGLHRVEVMLQVHGVLFRAEEASNDMYASIDLVVDKLEQQFNKYKSKLNKRFREQGVRTRIAANGRALEREDEEDADLGERVVRVKRFPMKPMDVEEAIMQMNLLGHDFYVFTNAATDEVNVVYRRKNGNYGLIEPQ
ncbi:ribosome hibernation-promoting factor, HPF/YfiA family [Alicyclobacillus macrosporangiidus]|jgi:putative sigma-54 modulation protein|uniref:Ribosome hibernation promoting factor n=1 Tax=Alicyclobacillus macrosporangiidus TaxID=392015 RepID=A0A1I7LE97_9BACL|nr:ribosome-associated translation inhibitor RaiA [Alicyclobacillus macrosporangiidus]SFV07896.1 putative sigma-54 modulation protein [Alicyclobacillus macrosporangiidus]